MIESLQNLLVWMTFVANVGEDERLDFERKRYVKNTYLEMFLRTFTPECREKTKQEIKRISEEGFQTLIDKRNDDFYHKVIYDKILEMKRGITTLMRTTYSGDPDTKNFLYTITIEIDKKVKEEDEWKKEVSS